MSSFNGAYIETLSPPAAELSQGRAFFRGQRTFRHRLKYLYYTAVKGCMFALLSVLRLYQYLRFGDMSNRMCLHTGSDTGADAEQLDKGLLLRFFSFVRKKRACPSRRSAKESGSAAPPRQIHRAAPP